MYICISIRKVHAHRSHLTVQKCFGPLITKTETVRLRLRWLWKSKWTVKLCGGHNTADIYICVVLHSKALPKSCLQLPTWPTLSPFSYVCSLHSFHTFSHQSQNFPHKKIWSSMIWLPLFVWKLIFFQRHKLIVLDKLTIITPINGDSRHEWWIVGLQRLVDNLDILKHEHEHE